MSVSATIFYIHILSCPIIAELAKNNNLKEYKKGKLFPNPIHLPCDIKAQQQKLVKNREQGSNNNFNL
ncbi:4193_t:CDS:2 [Ambispora leptoticha]|uniref:4193_t:CDS:1 n=1 Tax=Ambispora leptoticha TaxID=144679 RepID=A0A9N9FJV5_9GLOM|nr:4193_t:CDS:2 [Ambispora leptoticha]